MVKEIFFINLLSIIPKYYITSKSLLQEKLYFYTFLFPKNIDKPLIKLYLNYLFNINIKNIKIINLKSKKNKNLKKVIIKSNKNLNMFNFN